MVESLLQRNHFPILAQKRERERERERESETDGVEVDDILRGDFAAKLSGWAKKFEFTKIPKHLVVP